MTRLHRLLERQLRRSGMDEATLTNEQRELIGMVDAAYHSFEEDRAMLERSLELSSQELLQANSEMRAVLKAFPDLFIWLDREGRIQHLQAGDKGVLYLSSDQLRGKRLQDIPVYELREQFEECLAKVQESRKLVSMEYELEINGQRHAFEARLLPLVKGQTLVIIRNITEQKRASEALADEKERLRVTLRSIADGVITTDMDGRVVLVNRAAEELTGWTQPEAAGHPIADVFSIVARSSQASDLADSVSFVMGAIAELTAASREFLLMPRKGEPTLISATASAILGGDGSVVGSSIVFRDITLQKRQEEDRLRASKLESVGLLAGGIAHDFNNILTAVLANVSLAHLVVSDESEIVELLTETEVATKRARALTQQLLTFSRGGSPVKATASIRELIVESATFCLRGSNVDGTFDIAPDLLPVEIDEGQMSQVISNLIINADHAMPSGGSILIRAENVSHTDAGELFPPPGGVRISIHDQGVGISDDNLNKVFDPYFTTKAKGSGLGLTSAYAIVKNHGGTLSVTSTLGKGTTFVIALAGSHRSVEVVHKAPGANDRANGRLLLMDDDPDIRRVGRRMLEHLGHTVEVVADGAEAIATYQEAMQAQAPFRAVIMDLTIPGGMGGKEALKHLIEIDPDVRAIVSSGYSNDPVMANHRQHGFSDVLTKPFNVKQLGDVLSRVLG